MNKQAEQYKQKELTSQIINAAHTVHNTLGYGFLEKVCHNSLFIELRKRGFKVESEKLVDVYYSDELVGNFYADLAVEDKVIVEGKSVDTYSHAFEAQMLNYLKASGLEVGLIINLGTSVKVKRMVL